MSGLIPLLENSQNSAGRKRKFTPDFEEVCEGASEDWASAARKKLPKPAPGPSKVGLAPNENNHSGHRTTVDQRYSRAPELPQPDSLRFASSSYDSRFQWTVSSKRKPRDATRKYYGVRIGRQPGIYYSWEDAEAQISSFPGAVYHGSMDASTMEHFMNHEPGDCKYRACGSRCKDIARERPAATQTTNHSTQTQSLAHSERTAISATSPAICTCGDVANALEETVYCSNAPLCQVGIYHKKCVGLSNRKESTGWHCFGCRSKSSAQVALSQATAWTQNSSSFLNEQAARSQITTADPMPLLSHEAEPPLHPEQEKIVRCIEEGHNVFYTGSAGTGKSTVLKAFVRRLQNMGKKVDIVAPSGIAALNVGGMTIFSYASWRPDSFKEPLEKLLKDAHGKKVRKKLSKTDVLVIDEISMVERDLFSRLDAVMREARHGWRDDEKPRKKLLSKHSAREPFGGCQIVVTGDFCQLPPVRPFQFCLHCGGDQLPDHERQDGRPLQCRRCLRVFEDSDKWAFKSEAWIACQFTYYELAYVHRQNDKVFIDLLQKCRLGKEFLPNEQSLLTKLKPDPIGAVRLLPRKREVEDENAKNFDRLRGAPRLFDCLDVFSWRNKDEPELPQKYNKPLYANRSNGPLLALKDHRFEERIQLKTGMLVILLQNLSFEQGLVNGSQGRIVAFEKYDPNKPILPRPVESSPSKSGRRGVDSTVSERIEFKESQIRRFMERATIQEWPIVQFHNGVTRPIYADCQLSELGVEKPFSLLGRAQIPLLAAWAITIHKSQGMTLDRVIVDLYNSFEREMVYVALSRARNLEGLKVVRLARNMEKGRNAEVEEFLTKNFGRAAALKAPIPAKVEAVSPPLSLPEEKSLKTVRVPKRLGGGLGLGFER